MSDVWEISVIKWAEKAFGSPVLRFDHEVVGGCGEGTCEFTVVDLEVDLADGRRMTHHVTFGLAVRESVQLDLTADGRLTNYADTETWNPANWVVAGD